MELRDHSGFDFHPVRFSAIRASPSDFDLSTVSECLVSVSYRPWYATTRIVYIFPWSGIDIYLHYVSWCEDVRTAKFFWYKRHNMGIYRIYSINPFTPKLKKYISPILPKSESIYDVLRIGSVIIFHLSKLWKATFFELCDAIFLVRLQGNYLKLTTVRSEGLKLPSNRRRTWVKKH